MEEHEVALAAPEVAVVEHHADEADLLDVEVSVAVAVVVVVVVGRRGMLSLLSELIIYVH